MSCCPPGSWPELASSYKAEGEVSKLDGIEIYSIGSGSPKCIIWNYDIFGFNSGRSRQLCDLFSKQGYYVIMPDYYRGTFADPAVETPENLGAFIKKNTNWTVLESDAKKVLAHAKSNGAKVFGAIGTCWGSYPTVKMCAWEEFKCGVSMHPSHSPIMAYFLQEDEKALYSDIKSPQLFMPAGADGPETKIGGLAQEIMGDKFKSIEFPEMAHGWTTRGGKLLSLF
jgi:dienelactone hydrolase